MVSKKKGSIFLNMCWKSWTPYTFNRNLLLFLVYWNPFAFSRLCAYFFRNGFSSSFRSHIFFILLSFLRVPTNNIISFGILIYIITVFIISIYDRSSLDIHFIYTTKLVITNYRPAAFSASATITLQYFQIADLFASLIVDQCLSKIR